MDKQRLKPKGWLESLNCAIEGILWTVRTQRHMRFHLLATVTVLLLALFLHVSTLEFLLLALAVVLVLFAELINTALEVLVDLVSPQYHPLARQAKDVAAGAVLMASIGALVLGYLVLSRYLLPGMERNFSGLGPIPGELPVVSLLTVIVLVVLLKALVGKGTPLHGGMPSGHSAVAFSIATSIALSQAGAVLTLLGLAMAAMVSHSRLLLEVHTLREVLAGALLGVLVTVFLFWLFG